MLTDFTITDADIGRALDPPFGFLVNLSQTAPAVPEMPQFSAATQTWKAGYLQLRGAGDIQSLYCCRSGVSTPMWSGDTRFLITNQSLGYRGQLVVHCVPKGATYALTLSDAPNVALPRRTSFGPHVRNEASGVWGHKS